MSLKLLITWLESCNLLLLLTTKYWILNDAVQGCRVVPSREISNSDSASLVPSKEIIALFAYLRLKIYLSQARRRGGGWGGDKGRRWREKMKGDEGDKGGSWRWEVKGEMNGWEREGYWWRRKGVIKVVGCCGRRKGVERQIHLIR